jgi:hypothetical protein
MYWGRICRQIEEGTYKRHVARAEKRFGKAAARGKREMDDLAVDVDMAELEGADMDAILAEADAAADAIARARDEAPDTVPPPPPSAPISSRELGANGNAMRPAPLPAGMKPRVVLRKVGKPGEPAPSTRELPAAPVSTRELPAAPARDARPAAPAETPRRIAVATPASPMAPGARPPMQSSPDLGSQRKIIVRPRLPGNPESGGKMPVAQPRAPLPSSPDAGSQGRIPAAPASSPRFPMPPPPASARKIPAPTSSQNVPPVPDSEPSASSQRKSVPPGQKVRVPLPSQLGRTTKKE